MICQGWMFPFPARPHVVVSLGPGQIVKMSPKPFPLPLTVGNDVANISRFVGYVRDNAYFTRWARKVFTRSEWGLLARRSAYYSKKHIPQTFEELIVPDVEIHRASLSSNNQRRSSAKFLLAKYLTGRCVTVTPFPEVSYLSSALMTSTHIGGV